MKYGILITVTVYLISLWVRYYGYPHMYQKGFEAGKLYVRNCMLQQTDSILGCGQLGYIPDTITVKAELNNGGSYQLNRAFKITGIIKER